MSKKQDDIIQFGKDLDQEAWERSRDEYLQLIISKLDDPDYDRIPLVLDGLSIIYPKGVDFIDVVKVLQAGVQWAKDKVFENGD